MIAGPVLGGFWLGAYYGVGATVEEPVPEPDVVTEQPGGAHRSRRRAPTDSSTTARSYPGQRQRFVDGKFVDDDTGIEQVGVPKRELPFDPPKPWTPDKEADEDDTPAKEEGQAGLGIALPKPEPKPRAPDAPKRRTVKPQHDEEALIALLALMGYTWR